MRKLFLDEEDMDCSAIVEEKEEEDLTIQIMEEGVVLKNWTIAPSGARRVPGQPAFYILFSIIITYLDEPMTVTCNETMQYKASDSEYLEDDIIPEEIMKKELMVMRDSDLLVHQVLGEWAVKNTKILPYLHCVQERIKRFTKIEFRHVLRIQNEFADALATLSSMIQHPDKNFIDPIPIGIHKQPAYCAHVEEEIDGNLWFHDIMEYIEKG
ncbi:uncharacterized protein [Nicotiana tomentosiformis]|uniref:uncharacterized protein n=1 Tax=Nicotiana tomentosiformis TaxID=4098 RepID=UPI00388C704E